MDNDWVGEEWYGHMNSVQIEKIKQKRRGASMDRTKIREGVTIESESDDEGYRWHKVNADLTFGGKLVAHDKEHWMNLQDEYEYSSYIHLYDTAYNDVYVVVVYDAIRQCDTFICTNKEDIIANASDVVPYASKDRMEQFIASVNEFFDVIKADPTWNKRVKEETGVTVDRSDNMHSLWDDAVTEGTEVTGNG